MSIASWLWALLPNVLPPEPKLNKKPLPGALQVTHREQQV